MKAHKDKSHIEHVNLCRKLGAGLGLSASAMTALLLRHHVLAADIASDGSPYLHIDRGLDFMDLAYLSYDPGDPECKSRPELFWKPAGIRAIKVLLGNLLLNADPGRTGVLMVAQYHDELLDEMSNDGEWPPPESPERLGRAVFIASRRQDEMRKTQAGNVVDQLSGQP